MPKAIGSTGGLADAAAVEGRNGADGRRIATSGDNTRTGCKRKLDEIVQAPSPRRTTRQYSRAQKSQEGPHVADGAQKIQTRRQCGKGIVVEDNTEDYVKGKAKVEQGGQPKKRPEPDVRKKGSASKLIFINNNLDDRQKEVIKRAGFGGLLNIKCISVPEKLTSWLIGIFDLEKSELVIPGKGRIKVDDQAVRKIFNLPVGGEHIIYENNSGSDTFAQFYRVFGHEKDQVAPSFTEVENWLLDEGKGNLSDKWLQHWLMFAISTLLCPTSSTKLCVKAFHSVANPREVGNYNWCQLVVERLKKGIIEHKENNRKFVSGCFLFLTILYLDSLDIDPKLVDQSEVVRAAAWTDPLVSKVCSMDRISDNAFGKLPLKKQSSQSMLITPSSINNFVNSTMQGNSITLTREAFKDLLIDFSTAINQAVLNFTLNLCQQQGYHDATPCGTSIQTQTAKVAAEQPGTSRGCGRSTEQKIDEEGRTDADPINSEEAEDGTPRALDHGEQSQLVETIGSQTDTSVADKQVESGDKDGLSNVSNAQQDPIDPMNEATQDRDGKLDNEAPVAEQTNKGDEGNEVLTPKTPVTHATNDSDDAERNLDSVTKSQNSQASNTSVDEYEELTQPKPANDNGLYAGMSLFEFMGTPQNEKAKRPPEPMKFELPEIQGPSFAHFKMRDIFDNIAEMELPSTGDAADTNSELKEAAKKIEDKLFQEEMAAPPLPESKVKLVRTKRAAQRTSFPLKKQLAQRQRPAGMLPPLAPKKIRASHTQDDLQKEAATMQSKEPQDVPGNIGEQGEGRSHDLHKEPEVQLKKSQDVPGSTGERGEGRSNDSHKQPEVPKIMESKGIKDAPDAPSFDLGIDSPSKSTGSITESMLEAAYDEAMKKTEQRTEQMVDKPEEVYILKHVPRQLKDDMYREICKYKYFNPKSDTSPPVFQSDEIVVTARELANCVRMGRLIDTKVMQAGTFVLSQDPSLKKKKIMSHWVGMQMMSAEGMYGKSVEKAFTFKVEDYDVIVFPIWQEISKEPQAVGHWFTVVVNIKLQRIQVIDSLRTQKDAAFTDFASKVRAKLITIWKRYTGIQENCSVKTIYLFKLEFIKGFNQFGMDSSPATCASRP